MEFEETEKKLTEAYLKAKSGYQTFEQVVELFNKNKGFLVLDLKNGTTVSGMVKEINNRMDFSKNIFDYIITLYTKDLKSYKSHHSPEIIKVY